MTSAVRKEYDIMAAKLAAMYGAKWDKDSKARKMVVQAAEDDIRETCMKLSTYNKSSLSDALTALQGRINMGYSWDQFVCFVDKETEAIGRGGE